MRLPRSSKMRPSRSASELVRERRLPRRCSSSLACTASNSARSMIGACSPGWLYDPSGLPSATREEGTAMTPKEYELAVLERFRLDWPEPAFEVRQDIRLGGTKTRTNRQIDVAVFEAGHATPFLLVEAKKHRRRVDAGIAGSTIALVQDVGGIPTIMVSTSGFSVAAANHLTAEAIGHLTVTMAEAESLRWVPVLEERFAVDRAFKLVSGALVEALRRGDAGAFQDEDLAFEEWLAV